ncbi:hypothetical protein GMSM_38650 [Geomonas sp. Red276]
MNELVSVIIPLYNRERYIEQALRSIAGQSWKDLEVIVVDDGSTDSSASQAKLHLERYGLTGRVITIPNSGPDAARDIGVRHALGNYLAFLDSDDIYLPSFIGEAVDAMRTHETEWAFSDFYVTDSQLNVLYRKSERLKRLRLVARTTSTLYVSLMKERLFSYLLEEQPIPVSGLVMRRSLYDRVGGFHRFIKERVLSLEWEFMLRAARTSPIIYLERPLVMIRKHDGNISGQVARQDAGEVAVLKTVLDHYRLEPGERRLVQAEIGKRSWHVGYHYFLERKNRLSRSWFIDSFRHKVSAKALLFAMATTLPASFNQPLRNLKKTLSLS